MLLQHFSAILVHDSFSASDTYLVVRRDVQVDKMFEERFSRAIIRKESVAVDVVEITARWVRSATS